MFNEADDELVVVGAGANAKQEWCVQENWTAIISNQRGATLDKFILLLLGEVHFAASSTLKLLFLYYYFLEGQSA